MKIATQYPSFLQKFALALLTMTWWGGQVAFGTEKTEILWDVYGIPHIFSSEDHELFHAFGWAQMHSHGNLILSLYGQARGRAAEYWGEQYVRSDQWVLTNGIPERSVEWYKQQDKEFKGYIDDIKTTRAT